MLKFIKKFQDGSQNARCVCQGGQDEYNFFSTASLWEKPEQV